VKLKAIQEVLDDTPVFSPQFLSFTRQLSRTYYSSWGELLNIALPVSFAPKSRVRVSITEKGRLALNEKKISPQEKEILSLLMRKSYSDVFLKRKTKYSRISSLLFRLAEKSWVSVERRVESSSGRRAKSLSKSPTQLEMDFSLDLESHRAAKALAAELPKDAFASYYLFGPAAKREAIYFYLMREAISLGKRVLFLVPEIGLTEGLLEQFRNKLGERAALLHSRTSEGRRTDEWLRIKDGRVAVVVGPRSALFSPVKNLGLIIVDEEQDDSYFQRESPSYDARKGAHLRAKQEKAVLLLGSVAPSVEAYHEARKKGKLIGLGKEPLRHQVDIVDDRKGRSVVSPRLQARIKANLDRKSPSLIFCNRRGYAAYVACSRCRHIPRCRNCDIALTYHKRENRLACHYCDFTLSEWRECPECASPMVQKKEVGVEAVEEAISKLFPTGRVVCFDTDIIKKQKDSQKILSELMDGKIDILIGTQLLIHQQGLPKVSFAAVLYPEATLALSDFRASQRTFHMISQTLRFLRSERESSILIQTSSPDHYSIQSSLFDDYEAFFEEEIKFRQLMSYPPFVHMVEVLFQGENLRTLARKSREFSSFIRKNARELEILGPALTAVTKLRGRSRIQLILKAKKRKDLDVALLPALRKVKFRKSVRVYY
jgi:primosomal protein N' (replication factor Y)